MSVKKISLVSSNRRKKGHATIKAPDIMRSLPKNPKKLRDYLRAEKHRQRLLDKRDNAEVNKRERENQADIVYQTDSNIPLSVFFGGR